MKKARVKFLLAAMLAIFVLLTSLLGVINAVSFTMAAADADRVTEEIETNHGMLKKDFRMSNGMPAEGRFGPMGPESPDMGPSLRYFTVTVDDSGNAALITYNITAVSEQEAASWAKELLKKTVVGSETVDESLSGWTHGTYRYRIYRFNNTTYVTVVDQAREMLPAYRILIISLIGEGIALLLGAVLLILVSRRLFRPLEEADRRQKNFLSSAEKEFKVPLTIISADTELLERAHGSSEQTQAINRQIGKMKNLVRTLGAYAVFDEEKETADSPLTALVKAGTEEKQALFSDKNTVLKTEIEEDVRAAGEPETYRRIVDELLFNAARFAETEAVLRLRTEKGHLVLETENDTELPDGEYPQAFDRFTRLENAEGTEGAGLGLSYIRDKVLEMGGRVSAKVTGGRFTVKLSLSLPERRRS